MTRPQFVHEAVIDAQAGALIIHNELQGGVIETPARGAILDVDDCVGCSLCAQQCPRGVPLMIEQTEAEELDEEQKILFKAAIDTLNCHSCGVCQSLCPSGATQLSFLSNEQLWSEIESMLEGAGPEYPLTLCFYCEECSVSTMDIVGTQRMEYPASTRFIPVPCAGRVSIIDILKGFILRSHPERNFETLNGIFFACNLIPNRLVSLQLHNDFIFADRLPAENEWCLPLG